MKKVPTLFVRDHVDRRHVSDIVNPDAAWVFDHEPGVVCTRKVDGTCLLYDTDGTWWARRDVKVGRDAPAGFREADVDTATGKRFGWVPLADSSFAKIARAAIDDAEVTRYGELHAGTYELIGPKVNGNPEGMDRHVLVDHLRATELAPDYLRLPEQALVKAHVLALPDGWEGVVWHHPDGRWAKLKRRDIAR